MLFWTPWGQVVLYLYCRRRRPPPFVPALEKIGGWKGGWFVEDGGSPTPFRNNSRKHQKSYAGCQMAPSSSHFVFLADVRRGLPISVHDISASNNMLSFPNIHVDSPGP